MKKKCAMEYANLLQEYEEDKHRNLEPEKEADEKVDGNDQGLKIKIFS